MTILWLVIVWTLTQWRIFMSHNPKPNKNNEFLLDVSPNVRDWQNIFIYDLTSYLPHWNGWERRKYLNKVSFTIKGNLYTILIIDDYSILNEGLAKHYATEWYKGNGTYYRLD